MKTIFCIFAVFIPSTFAQVQTYGGNYNGEPNLPPAENYFQNQQQQRPQPPPINFNSYQGGDIGQALSRLYHLRYNQRQNGGQQASSQQGYQNVGNQQNMNNNQNGLYPRNSQNGINPYPGMVQNANNNALNLQPTPAPTGQQINRSVMPNFTPSTRGQDRRYQGP